jgi:hypothetical protein
MDRRRGCVRSPSCIACIGFTGAQSARSATRATQRSTYSCAPGIQAHDGTPLTSAHIPHATRDGRTRGLRRSTGRARSGTARCSSTPTRPTRRIGSTASSAGSGSFRPVPPGAAASPMRRRRHDIRIASISTDSPLLHARKQPRNVPQHSRTPVARRSR